MNINVKWILDASWQPTAAQWHQPASEGRRILEVERSKRTLQVTTHRQTGSSYKCSNAA
jgi:hypothetical protein